MLRLHHWVKNLLSFPPLLAHRINETSALSQSLLAFVASLIASAIYIINDLSIYLPIKPPTQKTPPFAGNLQLIQGVRLIPMLILGAFLISSFLPHVFSHLLLYLFLTTLYSLQKDFCLGCAYVDGLYTLRIIAGGTVHPYSIQMLLASIFFFSRSHSLSAAQN